MPAGHSNAVALVAGATHAYPAVQLRHDDHPDSEYCPLGQRTTVALGDAAAGHTYPALQLLHALLPPTLYVPGPHGTPVAFGDDDGHENPAGDVHAAHVDCNVSEYRPTGQGLLWLDRPGQLLRHTHEHKLSHDILTCMEGAPGNTRPRWLASLRRCNSLSVGALYLNPALQFVQTAALALLYVPAGHPNCVGEVEPGGHAYPVRQFWHAAHPGSEYCPPGHCTVVELIDATLGHTYPAEQLLHDDDPD